LATSDSSRSEKLLQFAETADRLAVDEDQRRCRHVVLGFERVDFFAGSQKPILDIEP